MFIYQSQNTYTLFNSAAFVVPKINADSDERHFYYLTGNTLLDFNDFFSIITMSFGTYKLLLVSQIIVILISVTQT